MSRAMRKSRELGLSRAPARRGTKISKNQLEARYIAKLRDHICRASCSMFVRRTMCGPLHGMAASQSEAIIQRATVIRRDRFLRAG